MSNTKNTMQAEYSPLSKRTFNSIEIGLDGLGSSNYINKSPFPLHAAARIGHDKDLLDLLKTHDPFELDHRGRTPLHYAVSLGNQRRAEKCSRILLNCDQVSCEKNQIEVTRSFVDIQDRNLETALHLAAKNESKKIVEMLILSAADVNLKSAEGKDPLGLIYAKVPSAMVSVLNAGVNIKDDCDRDLSDENLKLVIDFGPIVGFATEGDKHYRKRYCGETRLLAYALDDAPSASRAILTHPLVKLFLELKWSKIHFLFWFSIVFHIAWLMVYTAFIAEVYLQSCPYHLIIRNNNTSDQEMRMIAKFTWFGFSAENLEEDSELKCRLAMSRQWMLYVLIAMTGIVAGKEVFELSSVRKARMYFTGLENIGQWLLIISVVVLTWPIFFSNIIHAWIYEVAAFGIFVAWSLILSQIGKHPRLGLHVEILIKVLKSFAWFMLIFASLLIAFALSLSLLLPGNAAFVSLPLAFMKVVVMMTGELNYDEFFSDENTAFPVSTRIIYLFFVIVVSITLFNLLIGFTVSDIQVGQGLQQRAELNKLSSQLEQIFLMESFILSKKFQTVLEWCNRKEWLRHFLVAPPAVDDEHDRSMEISIKRVPGDLQKSIRKLAGMNSGGFDLFNSDESMDDDTLRILQRVLKEVMKQKELFTAN